MGIPFLVFLAAVGAVVVFVIVADHRLVPLTQRLQASWSDAAIQKFPPNPVAGFFQLRPRSYFELDRPEAQQVLTVSLGS